ncbi:DUF4153 domain-containing protein [Halomonas huangheensis]|uniref:DUF4153 domain-containing protein n=1 Tax=Halomonas huangheensis TaxID=1178482 RepID=W1N6I3_9GAMM|nr:DUF4153 domain-containing protein [Halomonas huangheensis]ALM54221.1 hypothetical protein AR456_19580 [Halomonas huangheensis]ERL50766.1 hypothetical protein BJB45_19410 [Halomonas huangheensis]
MDSRPAVTIMLIVIALVQGMALLGLHWALEQEVWSFAWLVSLYSMVLAGPWLLLLTLRRERILGVFGWTLLYSCVVGGLGFYVGSQYLGSNRSSGLLMGLVFSLSIVTFKVSLYLQQFTRGGPLEYRMLVRDAWRTALTIVLALLFAIAVAGLLALWGALFVAIDIDVFKDLFTSEWFFYPALSLSHGLGVALLRRQSHIFDTIIGALRILARVVLVILSLVSVLFLATLAFTGLAPLWASGGSYLVLWLLALMLFFVNIVYQPEPGQHGYAPWLHRAVSVAVVLLPIYSVISCYGLWLRIAQYGWTPERCWAALIWALLTLFSLGYCLQIVRRRDGWQQGLGTVNIVAGLLLMAAMLAVNSPLLDFRRITVDSQLTRLDHGEVAVEEFDVDYLYRQLGLPGDQALRELRERYAESHPQLVARIGYLLSGRDARQSQQELEAALVMLGLQRDQLPASLWSLLARELAGQQRGGAIASLQLLPLDLDANGHTDYLLVQHHADYTDARVYFREAGQWWSARMDIVGTAQADDREMLPEDIDPSDLELVVPRWREVRIGGTQLQIEPWSMAPMADRPSAENDPQQTADDTRETP